MHNVRFRLQIHAGFGSLSTNDVWLYRLVTLPFPPFPGLEVVAEGWSASVPNERSGSIAWDVGDHEFRIYLADRTLYNAALSQRRRPDLAELVPLVQSAIDDGWLIEEPERWERLVAAVAELSAPARVEDE